MYLNDYKWLSKFVNSNWFFEKDWVTFFFITQTSWFNIHTFELVKFLELLYALHSQILKYFKSTTVYLSLSVSEEEKGKISAQPHTIVKQICLPNGNLLFLSLFSLSKNWMHNVVWGCAEILPRKSVLGLKFNSSSHVWPAYGYSFRPVYFVNIKFMW